MRQYLNLSFFLSCILISVSVKSQILKRADSFFGIHFDLHSFESDSNVGSSLTKPMLEEFIKRVKPDFIQVDCKGHKGISSYPTKVGFPVKHFEKDALMLFRQVTSEYNVGLYVHFSGVYDRKVVQIFPKMATINPDGNPDLDMTSVFGPYVDNYLIPQLVELNQKYKIDGAWIDGECWAVKPDYNPEVTKMFLEKTGLKQVPRSVNDTGYYDFLEYNRKAFVKYLDHYVTQIHKVNPNFQITSNWAYSSMMPERPEVQLDFLSGDLQPHNSVNSAAFEARCLAKQGLPWDLMAWSFTIGNQRNTKSAIQLMQEAAEVISMGGGIQFYYKQNRDLSIQPWTIPIMEELQEFCRNRQPYCHKAKSVENIGILFLGESYKRSINTMYASGWDSPLLDPIKGTLELILDNQQPVEILMEHHVLEGIKPYNIIIIPEWKHISDLIKSKLLEYVSQGGNLIVSGVSTVLLFEDLMKHDSIQVYEKSGYYVGAKNNLAQLNGQILKTIYNSEPNKNNLYKINDKRYTLDFPSYRIKTYGKGKILNIYFNIGSEYQIGHNPVYRNLMESLIDTLSPRKIIVNNTRLLHVSLMKKENKLLLNLINTSGKHADKNILGFDEIPALYNINLKIRDINKPTSIIQQPEGIPLMFKTNGNFIEINIPKLEIHSIIEIF